MLEKMVESGNFPHLLFYGPPGAGKKTRTLALLHSVFGSGVRKMKTDHRTFRVNSKKIEMTTLSSNYHIEMNPSDAGIYDRVVVQDIIKEIASTTSISIALYANKTKSEQNRKNLFSNSNSNLSNSNSNEESRPKNLSFKVLVLNDVDRLTKSAQHGLRRTMEKYIGQCRIILQCNSVSKIIDPLRSRCLSIRIPSPSHSEISDILHSIALRERLEMDDGFCQQIVLKSNRNLRRAILLLQVCAADTNQLKISEHPQDMSPIKNSAWEIFIEELARIIIEEQSSQRLLMVRGKFYELLSNCIPADVIFKNLTIALMNTCDCSLNADIAKWAAYHEHRMQLGSKPIIHLEAFAARVMYIYKKWANSLLF